MKAVFVLLLAAGCATTALAQGSNDHGLHDDHGEHGLHAAPAPTPAAPGAGTEYAADAIFGPEAMARARALLREENGSFRTTMVLADELEWSRQDGNGIQRWDLQGWYGGDHDKLWLKSTGEHDTDTHAELQALWSHAVLPFFDLQAGLRHDFQEGPARSHAVLGLQGLVPYEFELDAALFLSERGDLGARVEFSHDLRLTQRLILQPELELELSAQDIPELGTGSGLGSGEFGLRLRYEIMREFAPYLGLRYARQFGATRDYAQAVGEPERGWQFVLGLRAWW